MNDWNTESGRREIVFAVFKHLREHPEDIPRMQDETQARQLVTTVGDTVIPQDVRVVCLPQGDRKKGGSGSEEGVGCSLVLEIPPDDVAHGSNEMLTYSCTYSVWSPQV